MPELATLPDPPDWDAARTQAVERLQRAVPLLPLTDFEVLSAEVIGAKTAEELAQLLGDVPGPGNSDHSVRLQGADLVLAAHADTERQLTQALVTVARTHETMGRGLGAAFGAVLALGWAGMTAGPSAADYPAIGSAAAYNAARLGASTQTAIDVLNEHADAIAALHLDVAGPRAALEDLARLTVEAGANPMPVNAWRQHLAEEGIPSLEPLEDPASWATGEAYQEAFADFAAQVLHPQVKAVLDTAVSPQVPVAIRLSRAAAQTVDALTRPALALSAPGYPG